MMVPHNLHLQMLEDGDEDYVMEKKQIPDKKRKIHKTSEQKGRQKINSQINYLKSLLPECASVVTTKAFILERAVDTLRRLQSAVDQMQSFNKKIAKENQRMTEECERQRKLFGISSTNPFSSPILSQRKGLLGSGNSFHFGSSQEDISLSNVKVEPFELFMNGGGLEEFGLETPIDFPNNPFSLSLPSSQEDLGVSSGLNDGYSFGNFSTMEDNSFSKFQFELPADGSFGSLLGFQNNDSPSLKRQRMV